MVAQPHFLLFCDTHHSHVRSGAEAPASGIVGMGGGRWHFVLEQLDGPERLEAADSELSINRERLALLSVVRGLEALEQPSQVTLVTTSRYVSRGLRYGLNTWRDSNYTWERFGEQRPVRNSDLWRRVDTALQFHGVKCRLIQAGQDSLEAASSPHSHMVASPRVDASWSSAPHEVTSEPGSFPVPLPAPLWENSEPLVSLGTPIAYVCEGSAVGRRSRPARRGQGIYPTWAPDQADWLSRIFHRSWWNAAASWFRWWRGRFQHRPVFYGT